ncbi:LuxR C-terminal-related transcriptional regulator [Actinoplanes sp. GCM10030250]|uniref:LuxR C-terminal-related transcriptional regulator n=1 Tax=Actinoplanes sp. GCM10030250 TaxID=3273376 RepID=UPI0036143E30
MAGRTAGTAPLLVGAAVPSLARWGVTQDADLVYRTVVTLGVRSAPALATQLGLSARRVHAALAELHEAGAVTAGIQRRAGRAPVWMAAPAGEVVERLRARRMRVADRETQSRSHRRAVEFATGGRVRPCAGEQLGDGVHYLDSRDAARDRLAALNAVERHEQLAINTEQSFDAPSARAAAPLDRSLMARGIQLRVLSLPPADGDLQVHPFLLNTPHCTYREAADLPMKLVVVDRRVAFFPADPDDIERGYLEVSHPAMVRSLVTLFDQRWDSAVDPRRCGMPDIVLSERERALINLLAEGHTDASAATRLRLSARSVTTIMRGLMDRVGVENRFQLGLALGAVRAAGRPAVTESSETGEAS